jgi:hypothetical protein
VKRLFAVLAFLIVSITSSAQLSEKFVQDVKAMPLL